MANEAATTYHPHGNLLNTFHSLDTEMSHLRWNPEPGIAGSEQDQREAEHIARILIAGPLLPPILRVRAHVVLAYADEGYLEHAQLAVRWAQYEVDHTPGEMADGLMRLAKEALGEAERDVARAEGEADGVEDSGAENIEDGEEEAEDEAGEREGDEEIRGEE